MSILIVAIPVTKPITINLHRMSSHIIDRLERLDYLIRTKTTGTPDELAKKLGISRSQLYAYLSLLKDRGAPISFSRYRKCFYYRTEGRFFFNYCSGNDVAARVK